MSDGRPSERYAILVSMIDGLASADDPRSAMQSPGHSMDKEYATEQLSAMELITFVNKIVTAVYTGKLVDSEEITQLLDKVEVVAKRFNVAFDTLASNGDWASFRSTLAAVRTDFPRKSS